MDEWGGCIGALVVLALIVGAIGAVIAGVSMGLAYAGLTFLIGVEFLAFGLSVLGIASPVLAWLLLGLLGGGVVGFALGLRRAGKRSAIPLVYTIGGTVLVVLLLASALAPKPQGPTLVAEPRLISPAMESAVHWKGTVGSSPASLDVVPGTGTAWNGAIIYQGVVEQLAVNMNSDGTVVMRGTSYRRVSGAGSFALDTFRGTRSPDGQRMQGSYSDSGGHRGQWTVAKIADAAPEAAKNKPDSEIPAASSPVQDSPPDSPIPPTPGSELSTSSLNPEQIRIRVQQLRDTAQAQFVRRDYQAAIATCDDALSLDPQNTDLQQLRTRIQQTMQVLGIAPPPARHAPEPQAVDCGSLSLRLYNVDDQLQASLTNAASDSLAILSASERQDTGFVDISSRTRPGTNTLSLKLTNYQKGYTYGYQLRSHSKIVDQASCGNVGIVGCNNNEFKLGVVFTHTFSFQCSDATKAGVNPTGTGSPGDAGPVYRVGNGVSAPLVLQKQEPTYTEEARAAKLSGTVVLYVEVDSDGHARNIKVLQSLGLGLDERAVEAVSRWRFRPGEKGGQPVTVAAQIKVDFRLL